MTSLLPASNRMLHGIALLCCGAVVFALICQHAFGMRPCAWCVFQRLIYLGIAALCWLTVAVRRWSVISFLLSVIVPLAAIGGAMAAWYQYDVASEMFSCSFTFADRFMINSGLGTKLPWLFAVQAGCMDAKVNLLGIEYALWSLMLFLVIAILGIRNLAKPTMQ